MRLISLVPSQTELLYDLGLDSEVVGITKFCVHPPVWFRSKTRIGGTKSVHIEQVKALQPDLIIANKEENLKEQVDALANICPVWTSDIGNLPQALQMIETIGNMTVKATAAQAMMGKILERFAALTPTLPPIKTSYLIWKDPYMTIGGDTFINDMLTRCGFDNIFKQRVRYPAITIEDIKQLDCQLLLLSSEPFPFTAQHIAALQRALPTTKILLVDGEMFSWYGSRLLHAPAYFKSLIEQLLIVGY